LNNGLIFEQSLKNANLLHCKVLQINKTPAIHHKKIKKWCQFETSLTKRNIHTLSCYLITDSDKKKDAAIYSALNNRKIQVNFCLSHIKSNRECLYFDLYYCANL